MRDKRKPAVAQAAAAEVSTEEIPDEMKSTELPALPDLASLRQEPTLTKELAEDEVAQILEKDSKSEEFKDLLRISNYAQRDMEQAPQVMREAIAELRKADVPAIAKLSEELMHKMEEAQLGGLRVGVWKKIARTLLGKRANEIPMIRGSQERSADEEVTSILEAIGEHKLELQELYGKLGTFSERNHELYKVYTKKGATAEVARNQALEDAITLAEKHRGNPSLMKIRELQNAQERVTTLDRRIVDIKELRKETFRSATTFDAQQRGIRQVIDMFNACATLMNLTFQNAVMSGEGNRQLNKSADVIAQQRAFIKELQESTLEDSAKVFQKLNKLAAEGVVDLKTSEAMWKYIIRQQHAGIETIRQMRGKLQAFSEMQDRMDQLAKVASYRAATELTPAAPGEIRDQDNAEFERVVNE